MAGGWWLAADGWRWDGTGRDWPRTCGDGPATENPAADSATVIVSSTGRGDTASAELKAEPIGHWLRPPWKEDGISDSADSGARRQCGTPRAPVYADMTED